MNYKNPASKWWPVQLHLSVLWKIHSTGWYLRYWKCPCRSCPPLIFFSLSITISVISHSVFSLLHVLLSLPLPPSSPSSTPFLSFSYHLRAVRKNTAFLCVMFFSFSNFPFHFFLVILFPFNIWGEKSFYLKVSQIHCHNVLAQVSIFKYKVYLQFPVFSIWLLLKKEEGKKRS